MYFLFGNKWLNIHGGPRWKVKTTEQGMQTLLSTSRKPEDVSKIWCLLSLLLLLQAHV